MATEIEKCVEENLEKAYDMLSVDSVEDDIEESFAVQAEALDNE